MPPIEFETHNLSRRTASGLRLRPRDHWHRHKTWCCCWKSVTFHLIYL